MGACAPAHPGTLGMLNDIYNKRIIELAGNIPRLGRLTDPDASATAHTTERIKNRRIKELTMREALNDKLKSDRSQCN